MEDDIEKELPAPTLRDTGLILRVEARNIPETLWIKEMENLTL